MAKYPVVVYGASGYTGMLTMDWLIDQNIPFTAVARDAKRVKEMMAQRVVRLESATYEIIEAQHTVKDLTKAFKGARVVCNTVGPFVKFGLTAVEAALKAGCHHLDTTGRHFDIDIAQAQYMAVDVTQFLFAHTAFNGLEKLFRRGAENLVQVADRDAGAGRYSCRRSAIHHGINHGPPPDAVAGACRRLARHGRK